jgi:hypothetical protein
MASAALILGASVLAHPAAKTARLPSTALRRHCLLWLMSLLREWVGTTAWGPRSVRQDDGFRILFWMGGMDFRYRAIASRSALVRSL